MIPFQLIDWPCPANSGEPHEEMALVFDQGRQHRLLVLPAWFDEANKLRRQTVEIMRRLNLAGVDSMLPDLPGMNESELPIELQTLESWRTAAAAAAGHFGASHVLAIRAGAMVAPKELAGWSYAPIEGKRVLRSLLRARAIASREAGISERGDEMLATARRDGIELAGWWIGPGMFKALETATHAASLAMIEQADIGGAGLWLRAEPDEDPEQADKLASILAMGITGA
ncbi:hypothetical protein GCM10011515_11540 [Tsuneonella deserti]|uniref:Uncharacterized protein n=1 Tax=Tsuneonella deserti TaxID=2035528 RepID=A0ABQ1S8H0_9SPHN|nr:hypothetical protein [Tsuneonella deserti]GGD93420.1 hypothetical protein GCM10011515_11540 [Tsuneonella deserti]